MTMPKHFSWRPNGPGLMHMSPRKYEQGHGADVAVYMLDRETEFDETVIHLPWGTRDPKAMEFDALEWCRTDSRLNRAIRQGEFVGAYSTLYHACKPDHRVWFYKGKPEYSEVLCDLWRSNRAAWWARVNRCLAPIDQLAERVPVGVIIDSASTSDNMSQSAMVLFECLHRGYSCGVESRLTWDSEWANSDKFTVFALASTWHMQDPDENPGATMHIPTAKLRCEQVLILPDNPQKELDAGRSIAGIYPSASSGSHTPAAGPTASSEPPNAAA